MEEVRRMKREGEREGKMKDVRRDRESETEREK